MSEEIIIIGNSFSGLGAAIAFAKYGHKIKVIAPNNKPQLFGGLQIAPNGLAALSSLDLKDEILDKATRLLAVDIKSFDLASTLTKISLSENKTTYVSIARQDLHQTLLKICLKNPLIKFIDAKVLAISQKFNNTTLILDNSDIITAPFIVGADGWEGKTRQFVNPTASQVNSGYAIYRCIFPSKDIPPGFSFPNVQLWLGNSCHLVSYPIRNGKDVNFVFSFSESAFSKNSIQSILSCHPILSLLEKRMKDWQIISVKNSEPLFNWRRGSVTLIGDAAHPMPPHLAQGAGQSFMDIACIETVLAKGFCVSDTLNEMIKIRMPEAHSVARKSQISGDIFRTNGPVASLRNQIIGLAGEKIINEFLNDLWLLA